MKRTVILFGISLAVLLGLLKWAEYKFFVKDLALEAYIGIVGVFCTLLGSWIGWKLTRPKQSKTEIAIPDVVIEGNTYNLSPRELEVLELIAKGHSYQEIAGHLSVSLSTVKTHASNIFSKMDVQRRTQAVMLAQKTGLLAHTKG